MVAETTLGAGGRRRQRARHQVRVRVVQLAAVVLAVAVWLWAQGPGEVSRLILPELGQVVSEFFSFLGTSEIYRAIAVTMGEILISLAIATALGFVIAFWAARTELRAKVVEPLLVWGYLVPHILFYPIIILWFGIGMESKVVYAASSAVFPIAFNSLRAFRGVNPKFINVGRAFGASRRQLDWKIKLRASVPLAAAGLRIGAALSMVTVIVAEMLSSTDGLGYLLKYYAQSFNAARSYAVIAIILLVVGVFLLAVNKLLPSTKGSKR